MIHNGINIVHEEFDSLAEYVDVIGKRKNNTVFFRDFLCSSHDEDEERYNFTLTNTYEEATEMALNGYKEGLDQMMALGTRITHKENVLKNMPSVNVVGYAPHVPNAIAGNPMSMIITQQSEQKAKVITIVYLMSAHCGTDANNFIVAGKKMLDVITTLETQGYRVGLNVIDTRIGSFEWAIASVQVKNWRQPSNPLKISYALIHPSFFRRHGHHWLETTPELTDCGFPNGYGKPLYGAYGNSMKEREDKLRELGVLKQNQFFMEFQTAYRLSTDKIIKEMGIGGK